jgi:hypothetical protein
MISGYTRSSLLTQTYNFYNQFHKHRNRQLRIMSKKRTLDSFFTPDSKKQRKEPVVDETVSNSTLYYVSHTHKNLDTNLNPPNIPVPHPRTTTLHLPRATLLATPPRQGNQRPAGPRPPLLRTLRPLLRSQGPLQIPPLPTPLLPRRIVSPPPLPTSSTPLTHPQQNQPRRHRNPNPHPQIHNRLRPRRNLPLLPHRRSHRRQNTQPSHLPPVPTPPHPAMSRRPPPLRLGSDRLRFQLLPGKLLRLRQ